MKILISGINGKMGKVLKEEVLKNKDLTFVGGISEAELENSLKVADVIIDFSHPSRLEKLLNFAVKKKIALVLATTPYTETEYKLINNASKLIPIIYSENYSLGIYTILSSLNWYANSLNDFEIDLIEKHHREKKDQPSGTAVRMVKELKKHTEQKISTFSIRSGNHSGEHIVSFSGDDEVVELHHKTYSKRVFALGAIKAAKFIHGKYPRLYTMTDLVKGD